MLGNAWHLPTNPEPQGWAGMLDPVGPIVPGSAVVVISGNQFAGSGNAGNQLREGSLVMARKVGEPDWTAHQMEFLRMMGNNKYFATALPVRKTALPRATRSSTTCASPTATTT